MPTITDLDGGEVLVTGLGHLYIAPVGAAFPANIAAAIDPLVWTNLGYVDPAGAKFDFGRNVNPIPAWQSYDPVRIVTKDVPKKITANLLQWNAATASLAMGGVVVTEDAPFQFHIEPQVESFVDQHALIVDGTDGTRTYRFCYRKVFNEGGVSFSFVRDLPAMLPVTLAVLAADGGLRPFFIQSNDPAWADAS